MPKKPTKIVWAKGTGFRSSVVVEDDSLNPFGDPYTFIVWEVVDGMWSSLVVRASKEAAVQYARDYIQNMKTMGGRPR